MSTCKRNLTFGTAWPGPGATCARAREVRGSGTAGSWPPWGDGQDDHANRQKLADEFADLQRKVAAQGGERKLLSDRSAQLARRRPGFRERRHQQSGAKGRRGRSYDPCSSAARLQPYQIDRDCRHSAATPRGAHCVLAGREFVPLQSLNGCLAFVLAKPDQRQKHRAAKRRKPENQTLHCL